MKKILLSAALSLVLLTGCGSTETITCTQSQTSFGIEMNQVINVEIKGNNFVSMDITIDAILPESLLSQKSTYIDKLETTYASMEKKLGAKPVTTETEKGAQIKYEMNAEQAKKFAGTSNTKLSKKELITTFEKQGYKCN